MQSVPLGERHPDGEAALELVEAAGIVLDPWQRLVFDAALQQRNNRWAAFEVGLVCPRQNGKNEVLVARELAGLFVLGEKMIVHSAHQADTSLEAFRRLLGIIEENDWLQAEVKSVWRTHGQEGIELRNGNRIRFRTRTKGGGRGFSGNLLVFDESMIFPEESLAAVFPIVSSSSLTGNPQVWYAGSAVDRLVHDNGVVLARVRERGHTGTDPNLAYFEWSVALDTPQDVTDEIASDPEVWAQANPGLGIRIAEEHIEKERRSMGAREFAVERLGVGEWPSTSGDPSVIDLDLWDLLEDSGSQAGDSLVFAFDAAPDRSWSSIAAASPRQDGLHHVEVAQRQRGVAWIASWLAERVPRHQPKLVVCDATGPAGSLLPELEQRGVQVRPVTSTEHGRACGLLVDMVEEKKLRHLDDPALRAAVRGAAQRSLGDAWAWSRKNSSVDISPLVASTLALWGSVSEAEQEVWMTVW